MNPPKLTQPVGHRLRKRMRDANHDWVVAILHGKLIDIYAQVISSNPAKGILRYIDRAIQ